MSLTPASTPQLQTEEPPAERPPSNRASKIVPATARDAARMAALHTELSLLSRVAPPDRAGILKPTLDVRKELAAAAAPIVRDREDPRFRVPARRLSRLLATFDGDLSTPARTSVMIVIAHQDDECVGAGAQLARIEDVTVVHVTDGAPRSAEYARRFGFSTPEEYGDARRQESREALALAGVSEENQLCLGIPDGEAPYHLVDLSLRLAEMFEDRAPDIVLTHPYEGGHTDHDAIAFAVHLACGVLRREGVATPAVLELTSYHNRGGRRVVHSFLPFEGVPETKTVRLSREAAELKARMFAVYATQQRCLGQFSTEIERFRPAPRYNFTLPPHEGTLDYERLCRRMSGAEWRKQAAGALERLRSGRRDRVVVKPLQTRTASDHPTGFLQVDPVR